MHPAFLEQSLKDLSEQLSTLGQKLHIIYQAPEQAIPLYETFLSEMQAITGKVAATGQFGAMMDIDLCNSGPVTIIIDTKNKE